MTETNPRELVEHFKNDQPVTQDMQSTMLADEMQLAADALTAALDRAEKAEAECRKQALEILSLHGQAMDAT